jgi:phage terminase large subunit-like protein
MLPILYEFPEDIASDRGNKPAWQDPQHWWMVTPNLDVAGLRRLEGRQDRPDDGSKQHWVWYPTEAQLHAWRAIP